MQPHAHKFNAFQILPSLVKRFSGPAPHSILEAGFWLVSLIYFLGILLAPATFPYIGLSIPDSWISGNIQNQSPKIFITEIYLAITISIALLHFKARVLPRIFRFNEILTLVILFLLLTGGLRILVDLQKNPMLVIRNGAFVWYLLYPIFLAALPFSIANFERFSRILCILVFGWSFLQLTFNVIEGGANSYWIGALGAIPFLILALKEKNPLALALVGLYLGANIGLDILTHIQRTAWLGMITALPFIIFLLKPPLKRLVPFFAIFLTSSGIFYSLGHFGYLNTDNASVFGSPLIKSESGPSGVEKYRQYMWQDAMLKFTEHPITGIGFHAQVVERVYLGFGQFHKNTGIKGNPPISGPHNSYLNAIARMGIAGFLFLALHALALLVLVRSSYFYSASFLAAGAIYSFFNVGLEGPIRSFLLLFTIGLAVKVSKFSKIKAQKSRMPEKLSEPVHD